MSERLIVPLREATAATCGGKAGTLGVLLRAGLPVPDGFVVPLAVHGDAIVARVDAGPLAPAVQQAVEHALADLGDPVVAVRSSAWDEDMRRASAAGQYDSVLAVQGVEDVAAAILSCWGSLHSSRATAYRTHADGERARAKDPAMAVLVHRHLDADVAGVMFTPTSPGEATVIEAAWGLGPTVVAGRLSPDTYRVHADGTVSSAVADKSIRLDRFGTELHTVDVPAEQRRHPALDDATATELARLGRTIAELLGAAQDIEWAVVDGRLWVLQSRPITVAPPPARAPHEGLPGFVTLHGTAGSRGSASGTARAVRGPQDFPRVRPGDILVCPFTDPAWTPLLHIAAGVITEAGGVLSHAAIVAREQGIPAVLGVPRAMALIDDGAAITIDGTAGTILT